MPGLRWETLKSTPGGKVTLPPGSSLPDGLHVYFMLSSMILSMMW
jgi:hypothetical protein